MQQYRLDIRDRMVPGGEVPKVCSSETAEVAEMSTKARPRISSSNSSAFKSSLIMDQWYGPGYHCIKVRGHDSSVYILRLDEVSHQCELIMFSAARAQEYQDKYHDLARSAQSRQ